MDVGFLLQHLNWEKDERQKNGVLGLISYSIEQT